MPLTMPTCIECGAGIIRDNSGLWCPVCWPREKQAVFRRVVTAAVNDLTASAGSVPERESKRLDISAALSRREERDEHRRRENP